MHKPPHIPDPPSALFPPPEERQRLDDYLTRELIEANARIRTGSVVPTVDMASYRNQLAGFDFKSPRPVGELLDWAIAQLEHGAVHMTHPRYFGLFNPAPTFPAQCADRIVGAFNPQLASSGSSPVPVELEAHVIRSIAQRAGLPAEAGGHFTSGGSEANYTALLCALTRANSAFATDGSRAFAGAPVFYTSKECHLAWLKIAHQAGIGRSALRLVATDGTGRMAARALAEAVESDLAQGHVPVMIVGTAGTTNAGMIDPLGACAAIAREHRLWYHVDAAWGGALIVSDELRKALAGVEQADSVTIDAHKWFATTMGCGMFLTRHVPILSTAFQVSTTFMPSNVRSVDPYVTTVQWSRRFLGLRLFLSLAAAGWSGYAAHVERAVGLCALLEQRLVELGWSVMNASPLALLCVQPPPGSLDVRSIARRVLASNRAWVAATVLEGQDVIRVCMTHGEVTPGDITELTNVLQAVRSA